MDGNDLEKPPGGLIAELCSSVLIVTGGMGSGKSTVSTLLEQFGAVVVRADGIAHEVVAAGTATYNEIVRVFGDNILLESGAPQPAIDRKKLGALVFPDPKKRKQLEGITHPRIRERAQELFSDAVQAKAPLVVYDCPLFFEGGLQRLVWKRVIVVVSNLQICLERIAKRDALSEKQARERIATQWPLEWKAKRAEILIANNDSIDALALKVEQLYSALATRPS